MTEDEKQIAKAKEDIESQGPDSQTMKDRENESVAAQERADGNKDSQSAKDRIDESEGAKKADEKRAEESNGGLEKMLKALISKLDTFISKWETHENSNSENKGENKLKKSAEKYGLSSGGAGESTKKEWTDEEVNKILPR